MPAAQTEVPDQAGSTVPDQAVGASIMLLLSAAEELQSGSLCTHTGDATT